LTLKDGARRWAGAASAEAMRSLQAEVARLAETIVALDARRQQDAEKLRAMIEVLTERLDHCLSETDLSALRASVVKGEEDREALHVKTAGVAEQLRWESQDLRSALAAIAERVEKTLSG